MSDLPQTHDAIVSCVERLRVFTGGSSLEHDLGEIVAALRVEPPSMAAPLARLASSLGLTPFEVDLIVLAGLPEEHEAISQLARQVNPLGEPAMSFGSFVAALGLDWDGRRHLREALEAGTLRQNGLIQGPPEVPLPDRSTHLASGLWQVIRGSDAWPPNLEPLDVIGYWEPAAAEVEEALRSAPPSLIAVSGTADRSARELAAFAGGALDRIRQPWVPIGGASLDQSRSKLWSAHCIARGATPVVAGEASEDMLTSYPGVVVACLEATSRLHDERRPVRKVEIGARDLSESVRLWQRVAPELNGGAPTVAGLVRVDHIRAGRATNDARANGHGGELSVSTVVDHIRKRSDTSLPASVRLVKPKARWTDLVLPERELGLVASVFDRIEGQVNVLQNWGFHKAWGQRGVRMLLSGPPGTGKTLAVEVLAAELGLDLMLVDLAALVSKWLGETEKNIAEVFDAAEQCQAVLFFDEADAIFGRRTDGGDAHARWANLETAYLLSRIDRFDGLVALATNLRSNIDDAFFRRLDVIVELADPAQDERVRLWQRHMPVDAPYDEHVDVKQLASLYSITGGAIQNASLSAAFEASAHARPIDQLALVQAVQREYEKAGRSFPGVPPQLEGLRQNGRRTVTGSPKAPDGVGVSAAADGLET